MLGFTIDAAVGIMIADEPDMILIDLAIKHSTASSKSSSRVEQESVGWLGGAYAVVAAAADGKCEQGRNRMVNLITLCGCKLAALSHINQLTELPFATLAGLFEKTVAV